MSWSIGYDERWRRDIGYGVPSVCDEPSCEERIDRGLAYVCGGEPYGGDDGCGLYFCSDHRGWENARCARCIAGEPPYEAKPDSREWITWKLTDSSWQQWRDENPADVAALMSAPKEG